MLEEWTAARSGGAFFSQLRNLVFTLKAMGRRGGDLSKLVSSYFHFIRLFLPQYGARIKDRETN